MRPAFRLLLAFLVGAALALGTTLIYRYGAALPMPWLRYLPEHAASCVLLFCDLCVGLVPAYLIGRQLFRHVSRLPWVAILAGLPWVVLSTYRDYSAIRELQLHPSFPAALQATLHSWSFLPGMLIALLSVPVGLWLAFVIGQGVTGEPSSA